MPDWLRTHEKLIGWLAVSSAVAFVATLLLVPWLVVRIPQDYFTRPRATSAPFVGRHPLIRGGLIIGKNLLGIVFVVAGIAMLVLPGQGVLTILAGIMLLDFPGKHRLERWVVSRPAVFKSINWIRKRAGHDPLLLPS